MRGVVRRMRFGSRAGLVVIGVVIGTMLAGGIAWAVQNPVDSAGVLHACYNPTTGAMHLNVTGKCPATGQKTPISWNTTGTPGVQGPTGATGAAGATGPAEGTSVP